MGEKEGLFKRIFSSKKGSCCGVRIEEITDDDNEKTIKQEELSIGCCNKSLPDTTGMEANRTDIKSDD